MSARAAAVTAEAGTGPGIGADAPWRAVALGRRGHVVEHRADGTTLVRHPDPLGPCPRTATERLAHWAAVAPERVFLAQRTPAGPWQRVSYGAAFAQVRGIAQGLLDRGLAADRPLAVLSGNGIAHALMGLAAMHVGVPYAPVSVPFSLLSRDHAKLRHVLGLLAPGLVFVHDLAAFGPALAAALPAGVEVVCAERNGSQREATDFDHLCAPPTPAVDAAAAAVGPDTLAKVLFTSGSSAMPKGVLNSHGMLCANQGMAAQVWPFLAEQPPVLLDWLPWNHTFGGNLVFGLNLHHGGTLHIDDGRALPGEFERSLRNLREVAPTVYFGVPKALEMLLPHLEQDELLRQRFFGRLQMLFYAAASLPPAVWDGLRRLSIQTTGQRVFTCTTMGSTETAPLAITANWDADRPNILGLPVPGCELKLVPNGRKTELRVRGPNVTRGYLKDPAKTAAAFDDEGWYLMGDALRWADPTDPDQGLMFNGRITEDYKLSTGTWVNAGPLRAMAAGHLWPLVRDVLPTGRSRDEVGLLAFLEPEACRQLAGLAGDATLAGLARHPAVQAAFQQRLDRIAAEGTSSVNTVTRLMLMDEALADIETTDKGTLSFNVVLERRAADIAELHSDSPGPRVLLARRGSAR
jgi:feruloyl-CoA synthase